MIRFLFAIVLASSLIACETQTSQTKIKINLEGIDDQSLVVFNIIEDLSFELDGPVDSITLDIDKEIILNFNVGWHHSYVHVKPGDQLVVDTLSSRPIVFGVSKNPSNENKYLQDFQKVQLAQFENFIPGDLAKLNQDDYKKEVIEKNEPLNELVTSILNDAAVDDSFKSAMQSRLDAQITNDLSFHKGFYQSQNDGKVPELADGYYAVFEAKTNWESELLLFDEGRQAASFYHSKDLDFREFDSVTDFFGAAIETAKSLYGQSLIAHYCNLQTITEIVNFGGGLDNAADLITAFRSATDNAYYSSNLDKTIEPWKDLVAGKQAPEFSAMTRDGETVKLSELKGKKVYVDVWATWCGPCIAEIPSLKKLEADLHAENIEFVSVSIDEMRDKEKWEQFINDRELTGLQLMAEGAWNSDVATSYNIKGIPRFLFIGEDGQIISADAPRPSSDNIKETLLTGSTLN